MTSISDSRCWPFPPHGVTEYVWVWVLFAVILEGVGVRKKGRCCNGKWFPVCAGVCVCVWERERERERQRQRQREKESNNSGKKRTKAEKEIWERDIKLASVCTCGYQAWPCWRLDGAVGFGIKQNLVWTQSSLLSSCVNLSKLFNFSEPWFFQL